MSSASTTRKMIRSTKDLAQFNFSSSTIALTRHATFASGPRSSSPSCTSFASSSRSRSTISRNSGPSDLRTSRRTFFSLPDIHKLAGLVTPKSDSKSNPGVEGETDERGLETDGSLQKFHARKILPYSQAQLYALVSDIPSYSSFIPFCTSSRILVTESPASASASTPSSASPSSSSSASMSSASSSTSGASASGSGSSANNNSHRRQTQEWKPDDHPFDLEAELKVGFGGLEETYVSRVVGKPYESVTATAAKRSPLFNSLKTTWSFSPASPLSPHPSASPQPSSPHPESGRIPNSTEPTSPQDGPTLLNIDLAFSFANPLHRIASQAVLPKVAERMVEAFEKRCLEVFGKGTS